MKKKSIEEFLIYIGISIDLGCDAAGAQDKGLQR
jgi:hypothetical protein